MAKPVVIKFMSDISKALRDIDRLERRIDKINAKAIKGTGTTSVPSRGGFIGAMMGGGGGAGLGALGAAFSGVTGSVGSLITSLGNLNPVVIAATAAFLGFIHAMKRTFEFGNLVEGAKIQLSQFTNERTAIKDIKGARKFSLLTPFGPAEVLGATASARQFGIDPFGQGKYGLKGKKSAMDIIGGLASFRNPMTGESIGMGRAAYAVAGGDTRLLRPFGSDVRAAYERSKEAGPLRSAAFTEKFLTELGKLPKVLNMAEAQSNSMLGMWSTIAGFAEEFWMSLSGASEETGVTTFWSQIKEIVTDIRDTGIEFTSYIMPYVTEFGTSLGSIFKFLWDVLKQVWQIIGPVLIPAFKILVQLSRIVWEVFKAVLNTVIALAKIIWAVVSAPIKLLTTLLGVSDRIESIVSELYDFVAGLMTTFSLFGIYMEGLVSSMSKWLDGFIEDWVRVFDEMARVVDSFVSEHMGPIKDVLDFFNKNGGPGEWGSKAGDATRKWIQENGPDLNGIKGGNPLDNAMKGITDITNALPNWAKGKEVERHEKNTESKRTPTQIINNNNTTIHTNPKYVPVPNVVDSTVKNMFGSVPFIQQ